MYTPTQLGKSCGVSLSIVAIGIGLIATSNSAQFSHLHSLRVSPSQDAIAITSSRTAGDDRNRTNNERLINASDYPTIQEALDAVPPEGGAVIIPPGDYILDQPLVVRTSDTIVRGYGEATHLINANESGQSALMVALSDSLSARPDAEDRQWRVRISDLRITGNDQSGHGIEARYVEEVFIQGVTISEHGADGIHLNNCYEDPRIADCLITYNSGCGLNLIGNHDIAVSANQFEENQTGVRCVDGFNLTMTGNVLDDHLGDGVIVENTYGSVIASNMIEECQATAIILDRDCYGITVSANVIAHNGNGVDLRDAHGCAVSANTFTIMRTHAIHVGPNSGRITIAGNNISDSYIGGGVKRGTDDRLAGGLKIVGARDILVQGNLFSSIRPKAIELEGVSDHNVLISNNMFVDTESDHGSLEPTITVDRNGNALTPPTEQR